MVVEAQRSITDSVPMSEPCHSQEPARRAQHQQARGNGDGLGSSVRVRERAFLLLSDDQHKDDNQTGRSVPARCAPTSAGREQHRPAGATIRTPTREVGPCLRWPSGLPDCGDSPSALPAPTPLLIMGVKPACGSKRASGPSRWLALVPAEKPLDAKMFHLGGGPRSGATVGVDLQLASFQRPPTPPDEARATKHHLCTGRDGARAATGHLNRDLPPRRLLGGLKRPSVIRERRRPSSYHRQHRTHRRSPRSSSLLSCPLPSPCNCPCRPMSRLRAPWLAPRAAFVRRSFRPRAPARRCARRARNAARARGPPGRRMHQGEWPLLRTAPLRFQLSSPLNAPRARARVSSGAAGAKRQDIGEHAAPPPSASPSHESHDRYGSTAGGGRGGAGGGHKYRAQLKTFSGNNVVNGSSQPSVLRARPQCLWTMAIITTITASVIATARTTRRTDSSQLARNGSKPKSAPRRAPSSALCRAREPTKASASPPQCMRWPNMSQQLAHKATMLLGRARHQLRRDPAPNMDGLCVSLQISLPHRWLRLRTIVSCTAPAARSLRAVGGPALARRDGWCLHAPNIVPADPLPVTSCDITCWMVCFISLDGAYPACGRAKSSTRNPRQHSRLR